MNRTTEKNQPMNPSISYRNRKWLRGLLMLIIFLSGAIVGTGGALLAVRQHVLHKIHHPQEVPATVAARLQRKFDLEDHQAQQVKAILGLHQRKILSVRREFQPQLEEQLDEIAEEIADVMDPKQRNRWEDFFHDLRNTWLPTIPETSLENQKP